MKGSASAEPSQEVIVGFPVASFVGTEAGYLSLLGSGVEVLRPFAGVVGFKIAPGVWLQIFRWSTLC